MNRLHTPVQPADVVKFKVDTLSRHNMRGQLLHGWAAELPETREDSPLQRMPRQWHG